MNRFLLPALGLLSACTPLVVDSALKGAALMSAALLGALLLWRASAAARHLVWLVAVVALLSVPVMSLVLPGWRVLPAWAVPPSVGAAPQEDRPYEAHEPYKSPAPAPAPNAVPVSPPPAANWQPASGTPLPGAPAGPAAALLLAAAPAAPAPVPRWGTALPLLWTTGCAVLLLRLLGAHWLLRRTARRARPVADGPLAAALAAAASQLGLRSRVRLLLDEKRTIPVVWGVFRPQLLLPADARAWSGEQLRSVLLHELAHIRRRDTLVQWITQIACALHWFNPLVWLAAWRLHVERERACDDLVLASGVKPSAYAEHLLTIATQFSPARWTQACGLAMARKSSLEGRLHAILSDKLNRRLTRALTAAAILLSAAIAVPIAMLRAADEEWNPPSAVQVIVDGFTTYCVHQNNDSAFILAYKGALNFRSLGSSNPTSKSWTNAGKLTDEGAGIEFSFRRVHTRPDKLTVAASPTGTRDLGTPASQPRAFGEKEYDLTKGRVFLLSETGSVRQLNIPAAVTTKATESKVLAAQILTLPPQEPTDNTLPKHKDARALYEIWQRHARTDGKIPGALIRHVAREVDSFLKQYPENEKAPQLAALRPRLDASRDWTQKEVVAMLDEITAISTAPVSWAATPMEFDAGRNIQRGQPLPKELESAAWGTPAENGLRAAWLLEPAPGVVWSSLVDFHYRLGTVLKARVLFHNTGKAPVVFQTETWHQDDPHTARDAKGAEIPVKATWFTGITPMATFRLAPGEYCEVSGHGIAIGAGEYKDERSTRAVGSIIEAKEGDGVTLSHTVDAAQGGWTKPGDPKDPVELRKQIIAARVNHEAPMPRSAADREQLIRRVTLDLTGVAPTPEEIAAFTADAMPDALPKLIARLQATAAEVPWSGKLPTGETKFRVMAADPNAAKAPRAAAEPGRYVLGDGVHLQVRQVTENGKRTNSAGILFFGPDPKQASPHPSYQITLPDGLNSYCFIWERGSGELLLVERGSVRTINFANPAKVTEDRAKMNLAPKYRELLPPGLLQEKNAAPATEKPKTSALKLTPDGLLGAWRGTVNGEKLMLSFHRPPVETDVQLDLYFGEATIGALAGFTIAADGGSAVVVQHSAGGGMKFGTLIPDAAGKLKLELYGRQKGQQETMLTRDEEAAATEPQQKEARELFDLWKAAVYGNETIPGMFLWTLVTEAQAYADANPNLDRSEKLLELFDSRITERDWTQPQVIPLLDAATSYSDELLKACLASEKLSQRWLGTWEAKIEGRVCALWIVRTGPAVTGITMMMLYPEEASVDDLCYNANSNKASLDLRLWHQDGKTTPFGRLEPVSDTALRFIPAGTKRGGGGVTLTRKIEVPPTEPREQAARELFTFWKSTANADGSIPGTFIGQLATEVRAFGRAHSGRAHADNLVKLLPHFATSRDWTPAEAISLLDDVAGYSEEPIEARVAKAKLPSGPMWRTMVEFQDIPVAIAKWSEAKDGLRIGLRVVGGQWSAGGSVRAELWLHNASGKDVSFVTAGPNRQDVEVIFSAMDAEGQEHWPEPSELMLIAPLLECTLPAGHVAMAKEFDVTFADADNDVRTTLGNRFRDLKPGNYQLRSVLWLGKPNAPKPGERIELTAPDFPFTLGGTAVETDEAKPGPKERAKPPERTRMSNDKYEAVAFQTDHQVNFVLVYKVA